MPVRYATKFFLDGEVNDLYEAQEYLEGLNMKKYADNDIKPLLINVRWVLVEYDYGYVVVDAYEELSQEILDRLSRWIKGQNSDGIGEGFEQQDFADCDGFRCSLDWKHNDYKLKLLSENEDWQDEIDDYMG